MPGEHMKILWLKMAMATLGGAVLSLLVLLGRVQAADTSTKSKQESPLACNAFALSPEQRNRHFDELGPALRALKKSVRELGDGYSSNFLPMRQPFSYWPNGPFRSGCVVLFLTST